MHDTLKFNVSANNPLIQAILLLLLHLALLRIRNWCIFHKHSNWKRIIVNTKAREQESKNGVSHFLAVTLNISYKALDRRNYSRSFRVPKEVI